MTTFNSIKEVVSVNDINNELIPLLELLEKVNPCNQSYDVINNSLVVSYILKVNLFNFLGKMPLNVKAHIVGLPISLSEKGYFGKADEVSTIIKKKRGLNIVLNADSDLGCGGRTLSTFIFNNKFDTFDDYKNKMRHPYRRRVNKALKHREKLVIRELKNTDFSDVHYSLYRSIMTRTKNPLEVLRIEFFQKHEAKMYEFLDKNTNRVMGFIQLMELRDTLVFMFCGFNKEDNDQFDLYYNMLLKIVEEGIESGKKIINFGQTSEETKLKIGCIEVVKYLGIYHSNKLLNKALQLLLPIFSYKSYKVVHNVFKEDGIK